MGKVHAFQKSLLYRWLVLITHHQFWLTFMEPISWSVHFSMEEAENPVQNTEKKPKKGRSQIDKVGRLKYNQQLLKQTLAEVEEVKVMLRTIFAGLKGSFNFEQSLIEKVACKDEVDRQILHLLFEAGGLGLLPKELSAKLEQFRIHRFQVSRRILRMNKRLEDEFGEHVAEQRGWHWALTSFAVEAWGNNEKAD
jgi:hypothetical protein